MKVGFLRRLRDTPFTRRAMLLCLRLASLANKVIPKRDRILFYEGDNDEPSDNGEAFCTWLVRNGYDRKFDIVWCVTGFGGFPEMRRCRRVGTAGGVLAFLTSRYVFFSFGGMRIRPAREQVVVNLWHGTPLKTVGKLTDDGNIARERIDDFSFVLAGSDMFVPVMARAFGCGEDRVEVLGAPRNDYLFSESGSLEGLGIPAGAWRKAVLWMPTYRKSRHGRWGEGFSQTETGLPLAEEERQLAELDSRLGEAGVLLVVKAHRYAQVADAEWRNIRFVSNEEIFSAGMRLYEFVGKFDALVTDYSSVYFDWLLLDRPLAFTLDDFEEYGEKRGFTLDNPLKWMPGRHIYDLGGFASFCEDVANGVDLERGLRAEATPMLCKYTDDQNCRRLAEFVGIAEGRDE